MELFDVKRRDLISFDAFVKSHEKVTETPEFKEWADNKDAKLRPFMRHIDRDTTFSHDAFDSTYDMLRKSGK